VVDLHVEGAHRPLPVGIELAVYRTVQHALMAVADEPVTITLRYAPDRLELDVDGLRPEGPTAGAALLAARERITALGGSFTTDAPGPGLRAVRARLPVVPAYV
jgi:glucose-6-phosphate-specific signal transduction histidine kinase